MKLESQVIVDQHVTVNKYLDLVHTARHMLGVGFYQKVTNLPLKHVFVGFVGGFFFS
jgi:hypothetical protein